METRRLTYLLELSRTGSMRAVADVLGTSTSTVSQQIALLGREVGAVLVEPDGRRVRLTAAGRRLADHAVTVLAAVEAARTDLDPDAEPHGVVRIAGFATAIRRVVREVLPGLADRHPRLAVELREHEPPECRVLLAADDVDVALSYDHRLAPAAADADVETVPLWTARWGIGVPDRLADDPSLATGDSLAAMRVLAGQDWIGNSRNLADEQVVRVLGSLAGVSPTFRHQADSLDLVEDLVLAGLGVGMLPLDRRPRAGITVLPLADPAVELRACALVRRGRIGWPPVALVIAALGGLSDPPAAG